MAKKKEKKAGKRMKKKELVKVLLEFFHTKQDEVLSLKYIFEQLHLTTHPLKMLCMDILSELSMDDYITEVDKHKYKLNNHGVEMTGTFQRKSNGKNSFIPEGGGEPIFVAERNSAHAMNNDKVRIAFYAKRRGREAEGEVIEILERANDTFVGTLEVAKSYAFLVTENRTLANDIFIPKEKLKGGKTGDKAIVKVVEWPDKAKNPIGQVIDILGRAGDNTTEMHAILAEFGLPYVYPAAVEKAADKIPAEISAEEIARREDFRGVTTFTIDPKDAKDFDDALSIRKIEDGVWEVLGVRRVDGEGRYLAEVAPGGIIGFGDRRRNGLGRIFDLLLEMVGQAVFGQDGVHLGIVLSGAAQYLDQLSGGAFGTQRPVRDADHDFVAVLYVRVVPLGEIDVHRHAPGIHLDEDGVVAHVGRAHVLLAAALHDAGDLAFEGPGVGAAGDDELHAVAVQSIQRIALADIYVVFELLGADIHRSCRDHLYDALLTGTLLAAETVLFLPALLDSALGEQFRDDFTGTKTALLGGAARGRSQMLEGELVVREFPEQVNDQRRAVECGRLLRIFQFIHRLK